MRYLATLGASGLVAAVCAAQAPIRTEFAIDRPSVVVEPVSVTVLPLPVPSPPGVLSRPSYTPEQLLRMSESELIDLYKCSAPAPVPTNYTPGLVIFKPGSCITVPMARVMECTAWQGKYFPCEGTMINRQFGVPTIKAVIYGGESWLDGGPSTVFDYADTSLICKRYRDEVRQVSPGVYLGMMHRREKDGPKIATWFALDARTGKGCAVPTGK
ncbi:MAG TPA: hypothetical protein VKD71_05730 [Gemmataceae bacterium]|nr:hypothetical protein [Gemmataceae bacterium]